MRSQYRPEGKVSRKEAAEMLGVSLRTMINYEEYGWLKKGVKIKGCGVEVWYDAEEIEQLSLKLRRNLKKD